MRRWLRALPLALVWVVSVSADLTITTTTTIEGAMAAPGGNVVPNFVTRIKGNRSRTDVEVGDQTTATIVDFTTRQAIVLRPAQKIAHIVDPTAGPASAPMNLPSVDATVKPTGQTREINGARCDEYAISMKMDLASMGAGPNSSMPPEAAAMMKGVRMTMSGSMWVAKNAPGAAEYAAFQQSAAKIALGALTKGGAAMPAGMERLISGFSEAPGIPYLTEMTMAVEGSGQIATLMKGMGGTKITSQVTGVSTEPLSDELFVIPAGYTVEKQ